VKKKHSQILEDMKSGYKAEACISARHQLKRQEEWKSKLLLAMLKLEKETDNWKQQLYNLDIKLTTAKDRVYIEKIDKLAQQEKTSKQLEMILEEYRSQLKLSNKNQCELKKEWEDKEAKRHHGGRIRWLPWLVRIICEMLVNG
jgi:hypothetical protein